MLFPFSSRLAVWPSSRGRWATGFISLDDPTYIVANPFVQGGLSRDGIVWAFTTAFEGNWDPVTWLSHMLDVELFGSAPAGHHLTSVLLHVANGLILFHVLLRMSGAPLRSGFVAALFLAHPLHVEAVAWAAERKEVLCAFFTLLTLWAWSRYTERSARGWYATALALFVLALMSKPMAVTLPFVLLLLDWWPLGRLRFCKGQVLPLIVEKLPFLAMTAGSCVIAFMVQQQVGALVSLSLRARVQNAIVSYAAYVANTVWPVGLSHYYPHPGEGLPLPTVAASFGSLAVATVVALRLARRAPCVTMGWFWFLGTLVPVIGIVQFGNHARADRFTYLPLVGLFIALSWGFPELLRRWRQRRWLLPAAAGIALAALGALTWRQLGYWKGDLALYQHAVEVDANNWVAQNALGGVLGREGRLDEAVQHFQASIRAKPVYADAHFNLGVALYRKGRWDEALGCYREALRLDPENPDRWVIYSGVLEETGRRDEAVAALREALRRDPQHQEALRRLHRLSADRRGG